MKTFTDIDILLIDKQLHKEMGNLNENQTVHGLEDLHLYIPFEVIRCQPIKGYNKLSLVQL